MKTKLTLLICALSLISFSQSASPQMADELRESGKIYVVVGVISIVFICIIGLLIYIERKLSKIEKQIKKEIVE